jgi:hypothetical protein
LNCLVALRASFAASGAVKSTAHIAPTFHAATLLAIRVSRTGPNLPFFFRLSHLVIKKTSSLTHLTRIMSSRTANTFADVTAVFDH